MLEAALRQSIGDWTFQEAYDRTGRIININVSPLDSNDQPRLLNFLTAPNVLVRSACMASCSIPGKENFYSQLFCSFCFT
jgi:TAG lipase/steryl ester hydrolase/phospholipase A2/LPA acyltransferase